MPQTLLLSTTDRNCRPTWHKFQRKGGKSTHTQYTHLASPFWILWQNFRPVAPNQEKPHTTPSLIYISTYHWVYLIGAYWTAFAERDVGLRGTVCDIRAPHTSAPVWIVNTVVHLHGCRGWGLKLGLYIQHSHSVWTVLLQNVASRNVNVAKHNCY